MTFSERLRLNPGEWDYAIYCTIYDALMAHYYQPSKPTCTTLRAYQDAYPDIFEAATESQNEWIHDL